MARMTASASSDPLDPLPFRAGDAAGAEPGVEGGPAEAGVSSPAGRGGRDRRGRGLRHPRPFGARSERGRGEALLTAVEKAVDRLGSLDAPGLR
ncbi:MAG: hypothetical protein DI545_05625, partial [Micrococcus luteus]